MKKNIVTMAFVLLAIAAQAQIKMHSDGRITFQTLANTNAQGVTIGPAPDWNTDFNGNTYFKGNTMFTKITSGYQAMTMTHSTNQYASTWVVAYPDWNTLTFYVRVKGDAYAKHHYTITNRLDDSKGESGEPISGTESLKVISGLQGYYHAPEEVEIPDLESDEGVDPKAVEAMYADFGKRTVGLSSSDFVEAFPEGVRTDPQNRLCIDYSSVVTMLVEAVKEQQREIEDLRKALEENGLMRKNR